MLTQSRVVGLKYVRKEDVYTLLNANKANTSQQGFTLVESLVALVILALVISAISQWLSSAQTATLKIEQANQLVEVFEQSMTRIALEDLENKREGRFDVLTFNVVWRATIDKQSKDEAYRRQPEWNVVLFTIDLEFWQANKRIQQISTKVTDQWLLNPTQPLGF